MPPHGAPYPPLLTTLLPRMASPWQPWLPKFMGLTCCPPETGSKLLGTSEGQLLAGEPLGSGQEWSLYPPPANATEWAVGRGPAMALPPVLRLGAQGPPGVTTSAPLATWDKRHFLHSLSPSSSCPGPRGLPIRPALPQLCPEALDQPHPLGLELNQNLVTIPASAHRLLAPRAANAGWAATAPGQDGAASGAHPHGGDHPCGSPPPALQAGKWHTAGGEEREACHLVICARQPSPGRSTVRSAVGPLG